MSSYEHSQPFLITDDLTMAQLMASQIPFHLDDTSDSEYVVALGPLVRSKLKPEQLTFLELLEATHNIPWGY